MARIAELLRSPRKRSRVTELCQEKTDEKGMFQGVVVAESRSVLARYGPITAQRRSDVTPAAPPRGTATNYGVIATVTVSIYRTDSHAINCH